MKKYIFLLLFLTFITRGLAQTGVTGQAFEGEWNANTSPDEGFASYLNYTFIAGTYEIEGYPPLSESGTYEVVFEEKDEYSEEYVLVMNPHESDPEGQTPYMLQLSIRNDGSLRIESLYSSSSEFVFSPTN